VHWGGSKGHTVLDGDTAKCNMGETTDNTLPTIYANPLVQFNYINHLRTSYHTLFLPEMKFNGAERK
jgi:hypothetical protein